MANVSVNNEKKIIPGVFINFPKQFFRAWILRYGYFGCYGLRTSEKVETRVAKRKLT